MPRWIQLRIQVLDVSHIRPGVLLPQSRTGFNRSNWPHKVFGHSDLSDIQAENVHNRWPNAEVHTSEWRVRVHGCVRSNGQKPVRRSENQRPDHLYPHQGLLQSPHLGSHRHRCHNQRSFEIRLRIFQGGSIPAQIIQRNRPKNRQPGIQDHSETWRRHHRPQLRCKIPRLHKKEYRSRHAKPTLSLKRPKVSVRNGFRRLR